jgi:hypothetical protein
MRGQLRLYLLILSLALVVTQVGTLSTVQAQTPQTPSPAVVLPGLAGPWQATLFGNTGCGLVSMLVTFTLNPSGMATDAVITTHALSGSPCDGGTSSGNTFTITSLGINGAGTAGLSCGVGCGWNFRIQVAPSRQVFNIVDVDTANPNNLLQGLAIHQ